MEERVQIMVVGVVVQQVVAIVSRMIVQFSVWDLQSMQVINMRIEAVGHILLHTQ